MGILFSTNRMGNWFRWIKIKIILISGAATGPRLHLADSFVETAKLTDSWAIFEKGFVAR